MEVLKSGKRTIDSLWYGECNECGAIVSAKGNELTNIIKGDYVSDFEDFAWEDCPYCKTKNSVCFHESGTKSGQRVYALILDSNYSPYKEQ
jgi:threonine dehydrogenase-like Zn-dependent dehydrogenase